jgi:hypothetical protein
MIEFLLRLWYWLLDRLWSFPIYQIRRVEDRPEVLASGTLYLIGHGTLLWEAAMRCPKGCGHSICVNLLREENPCWRLDEHADGTVSLTPSIWRKSGCGCHFFLKHGRIQWV